MLIGANISRNVTVLLEYILSYLCLKYCIDISHQYLLLMNSIIYALDIATQHAHYITNLW